MSKELKTIPTDKEIITEEDIASACNGNFLEKIQEFARRGKEAKIPDQIVKLYNVRISLNFGELEESLSFDKVSGYELHIQPFTQEDLERIEKAKEEQNGSEPEPEPRE